MSRWVEVFKVAFRREVEEITLGAAAVGEGKHFFSL